MRFASPTRSPAFLALLISVTGFVALALLVTEGATDPFDRWFVAVPRTPTAPFVPLGPGSVSTFFTQITHAGGHAILGLAGVLLAGFLALLREWRRLGFVTLSLLGGAPLAWFFKRVFERVRPDIVPHLVEEASHSFPSGHATYSALSYVTFCILLFPLVPAGLARAYLALAAALIIFLIGFSRIWLGVHYPSDVLAGWCLGIAWASGSWLVVDSIARR